MKVYVLLCFVILTVWQCVCDDAVPQQVDQVKQDIQSGLTNFALKLNKYLYDKNPEKNVIIAPVSIYSALSLAILGSAGETERELVEAVGLSAHKHELEKVHSGLSALLKAAQSSTSANLTIANNVFIQSDIQLKEPYKQDAQKYYDSPSTPVNFAAGGNEATNVVNQWVSEKTHEKIPKLYEEPIDSQTISIIASALYFEAEWLYHFSPSLTSTGMFHATGGKNVRVQFMTSHNNIQHYRSPHYNYSAIILQYLNNDANMLIVQPMANKTISDLFGHITQNEIRRIIRKAKWKSIKYTLPKFNLGYGISLVDSIKSLGVETAFDSHRANFSKLVDNAYIRDIKHVTKLQITEFGTVGGAATGISISLRSFPKIFKVNRSFMFVIYQPKTEAVIFMGIINDPMEHLSAT